MTEVQVTLNLSMYSVKQLMYFLLQGIISKAEYVKEVESRDYGEDIS